MEKQHTFARQMARRLDDIDREVERMEGIAVAVGLVIFVFVCSLILNLL